MSAASPRPWQKPATVGLCGLLHFFTHAFVAMLVPLYLLIRSDLALPRTWMATLLVTIQGAAYCLTALPAGRLADAISRKLALTLGLLVNSLAFIALAFVGSYWQAVVILLIAGVAGGFYHPAGNALLVSMYPQKPGRVMGLAGMGAAVGFFFGPTFAGWRADAASWRAPCFELGLAGLLGAAVFWLLAYEAPVRRTADRAARNGRPFPLSRVVLGYVAGMSLLLGFREFGGSGVGSLSSLYLQSAQAFTVKKTGLFLGLMSLPAFIGNPIFGSLSDSPRRLWWAAGVLLTAGACALLIPFAGLATTGRGPLILTAMVLQQLFLLSSFPVVEAALGESVPDQLRGRAFGMYTTIAGLIGSTSAWAMGSVLDLMRERAASPAAFVLPFSLLALMIVASISALFVLRALRRRMQREGIETPVNPVGE